jgi:hypothetical protein
MVVMDAAASLPALAAALAQQQQQQQHTTVVHYSFTDGATWLPLYFTCGGAPVSLLAVTAALRQMHQLPPHMALDFALPLSKDDRLPVARDALVPSNTFLLARVVAESPQVAPATQQPAFPPRPQSRPQPRPRPQSRQRSSRVYEPHAQRQEPVVPQPTGMRVSLVPATTPAPPATTSLLQRVLLQAAARSASAGAAPPPPPAPATRGVAGLPPIPRKAGVLR